MGFKSFRNLRVLVWLNNPILLLLILSGVLSLLFVWMSIRSLSAIAPIWVEGPPLGTISAIRSGRLYQIDALQNLPYAVQTHMPLSYWLGAAISTKKVDFWPLRLANMLTTLAGGALIWIWVAGDRQAANNRVGFQAAFFAVVIFLLSPAVFLWSQPARMPDSLATFFTLAALLIRLRMRDGLLQYALFAGLGACAILSKQTALVMLAGSLSLYDLPRREFRGWFFRMSEMAIALAGPLLWLQLHSGGGFYRNVVAANFVTFNYATWYELAIRFSWMFWLFAAAVLALGTWWKRLEGFYLIVSCLFGLITCSKMGADIMYFFDASAAAAIVAGSAIRNVAVYRPGFQWIASSVLAATLIVMVSFGDVPRLRINEPYFSENYRFMLDFISTHRNPGKTILSEEACIALQLGEMPVIDDPFVFGQLWKKKVLDSSALIQAVHQHKFYAVILRDPSFWSDPVFDAIWQEYFQGAWIEASPAGGFYILFPR